MSENLSAVLSEVLLRGVEMKRGIIFFCLILLAATVYAQQNVVTTLSEEFSGKLFLYDDKEEAISGLKANLSERLEKRLKKMGFSDDYIITLLKKAKYSSLNVTEKRVEILKDNKKVKTTAFDIAGSVSVGIDENDIRELAEMLKRISPISDEEKQLYREALRNFLSLSGGIKDLDVSFLKLKLSEIIKADIIRQIQTVFASDNTSFQLLQDRVVDVLNNIELNKKHIEGEENIRELSDTLLGNVELYFKRSVVDITNYENAVSCAVNIAKMMPLRKDDAQKSLMFIIEFKWAENIQNISASSNVEVARLYSETDAFLNAFKDSRFLKNIRNKLVIRLGNELKDEQTGYDSLQFILLIYERLGLKELDKDIVKKCESVMESIESASDEASSKIEESFRICIKHSDPAARKRLTLMQEKFVKSDKNRVYRNMLGNLAFIMRFVRYADQINFGLSPEKVVSGKFGDFLNEGSVSSGCSCAAGESDECRIFVYAGDQFEVVLRYNEQKLYEVSICNMNMKGKSSVVLSYLRENFRPLFKANLSQIEEKDGSFDYELKKDVIVSVEKVGFFGSLSVYDKKTRPKIQNKVSYSAPQGYESLRKGDCVEWDCDLECRYKGKIEKVSADGFQVIIISAPKASELNMRKHMQKSSVKKCQSF